MEFFKIDLGGCFFADTMEYGNDSTTWDQDGTKIGICVNTHDVGDVHNFYAVNTCNVVNWPARGGAGAAKGKITPSLKPGGTAPTNKYNGYKRK